jgi:lipopolysaccharide export system ATP-binding protein
MKPGEMRMPLLKAEGLVKWYGSRKVVDGVSYEVNAGEVVGLLGSNGAGKTTSFRMTTGQIVPNGGKVTFNGEDVTALPMFRRARLGMGYLSQEQSIFRKLTVEENLIAILEALPRSRTLGRRLTRSERWDRTEAALKRFNLLHVRKNSAARCSGGEKRRLEIARCLVCEPLLILLDEPFAAVDPKTTEDIRANIRELAQQGIGILLTDHNVREVLKITDRSYLIQAGQVVTAGTPSQLIRDPIAIREYLGNTFAEDGFGMAFAQNTQAMSEPPIPLSTPSSHVQTPVHDGVNRAHAPMPARPKSFLAEVPLEVEEPIPLQATEAPAPPASVLLRSPAAPAKTPTLLPPVVPPPPPPRPVAESKPLFGMGTHQLLEQEKMRRWVEQLQDRSRMSDAWHELISRGQDAIPVLLEALERRELDIRHLALRLLESITSEQLTFTTDANEDVRIRQLALLRAKLLSGKR